MLINLGTTAALFVVSTCKKKQRSMDDKGGKPQDETVWCEHDTAGTEALRGQHSPGIQVVSLSPHLHSWERPSVPWKLQAPIHFSQFILVAIKRIFQNGIIYSGSKTQRANTINEILIHGHVTHSRNSPANSCRRNISYSSCAQDVTGRKCSLVATVFTPSVGWDFYASLLSPINIFLEVSAQ